MSLTFPTRPNHARLHPPGHPARATPCHCEQPLTTDDRCIRCGHYPAATIQNTWKTRAQTIAQHQAIRERLGI